MQALSQLASKTAIIIINSEAEVRNQNDEGLGVARGKKGREESTKNIAKKKRW
jgi:hypothetical protein